MVISIRPASDRDIEALRTLRREWGYCGPLTMEPSGLRDGDWEDLVAAMASLRGED